MKAAALSFVLLCAGCAIAGGATADLAPILRSSLTRSALAPLRDPVTHRIQILVSAVEEHPGRAPRLRRRGYRLGAEYFYPASAIKLAAAVASLQALEDLAATHGVGDLARTPLEIDPLFPGDPPQRTDPTNLESGRITVLHEIRKLALVSDNQAFNRLVDLVGFDALNASMHRIGLSSTVITHRLSDGRSIPDPRASARVIFFPAETPPIAVPARTATGRWQNHAPSLLIGRAFLRGLDIVPEPMDFTERNGISVLDLQNLLIKVARPDIEMPGAPLRLSAAHRELLLQAMTDYPRESINPLYPAETYPDEVSKFLLPGVRRVFPSGTRGERITITNKIGQAYGFTTENAYLRNPANGRAVFVTAVIYTNRDGVLNDDRYEYDTVALPFMAELGSLVTAHWLR